VLRLEFAGSVRVLDSAQEALYNARASACPLEKRAGAQVAQLVEHVTENHGVGGSIPPLGTKKPSLLTLLNFLCGNCPTARNWDAF
jgi:hypothetical protein